MLTKRSALFQREAAERRTRQAELRWLEKVEGEFSSVAGNVAVRLGGK